MAGEMKPMNAPKSDSSSQSESDFCEENEQEEDKTKPMNLLANNGIHSTPTDKEEAPNRPFKYSHSRLPRPDTPTTLAFPMTRVRRLIRSEGDIRTNLEAAFLINKAVEQFLEQFVEDSFEYVLEDNRNTLSYKHLSSNVANQKRYEFLADFVPQKVRAVDALSEKASAES